MATTTVPIRRTSGTVGATLPVPQLDACGDQVQGFQVKVSVAGAQLPVLLDVYRYVLTARA